MKPLGFSRGEQLVMPDTDAAKRRARTLARTPWAKRGWGAGRSTRSIEATAIGEVEVVPETADVAPRGPH